MKETKVIENKRMQGEQRNARREASSTSPFLFLSSRTHDALLNRIMEEARKEKSAGRTIETETE